MRTLLTTALLTATALLAGCAGTADEAETQSSSFDDPARAAAQAKALPAPVSLRIEGDLIGSAGQSWAWPVADVAPTTFMVRFEFSPPSQPSPGYLLQDTSVRLVDPLGMVQGQYDTPFTLGQFQETAIDFYAPPYSAVTAGNWTVELSSGQSLAHYLLEVVVSYEPVVAEEAEAEVGTA